MSEDVIEYRPYIENINSETCFGIMTVCNGKAAFFEAVNRHGDVRHFKAGWNSVLRGLSYPGDHELTDEAKKRICRYMAQAGQQIPEPFRPIFQMG